MDVHGVLVYPRGAAFCLIVFTVLLCYSLPSDRSVRLPQTNVLDY